MATVFQSNAFQNNAFQIDSLPRTVGLITRLSLDGYGARRAGSFAGRAEAPPAPAPAPAEQPSGGYEYARTGRRRTPEDIHRDRVRFGVLPDRIIEDVALRQA
jgi:hypothetical protein